VTLVPAYVQPSRAISSPDRGAVLITRPEPGAGETAARITALGLRPIIAPLLMIAPRRANLPPSARVQAIVATSRNAIPALPASHRHLPLFAVGAATARHASAAGFEQVTSADANADALTALLAQACDREAGSLLLVTGQDQGTALASELRARGFRVVRRVAYASVPVTVLPDSVHRAFAGGNLSAALFFSAETARTCVRLLQAARLDHTVATVAALAIGPSTAVALQRLPWRRIRVAAQPNQDAMLALLR
jgi:uroporphyrinogen-III synthase